MTIYLPEDIQKRIEASASLSKKSKSQFVREILERWSDVPDIVDQQELHNRSIFLELATDALLKGHPDKDLRDLVHSTYRERLQRRRARGETR
ncbi:hypothetical protein [Sphingomonas oryzagri]